MPGGFMGCGFARILAVVDSHGAQPPSSEPAITVVVACVEASRSIEKCLASIDQACAGLRAQVVVVDASRDRTQSIVGQPLSCCGFHPARSCPSSGQPVSAWLAGVPSHSRSATCVSPRHGRARSSAAWRTPQVSEDRWSSTITPACGTGRSFTCATRRCCRRSCPTV